VTIGAVTNWQEVPADSFCESVRDGTHDSPKFLEAGHPLITSKNIRDGRVILETANLISEHDFKEVNRRSKVDQWDVLFSMIGTVGEVSLVRDEEPPFAIKNIGLFKVGDELKGKWLYYWLRSPATQAAIQQARRGASQQYIPLGELRSFPIRVPTNRVVMRNIVELLSNYDDLIENNRRRMALLEEAARQLYREWFVRLRFPGHEHTRIIDGVPEGWERKKIVDVWDISYGKNLPTKNIAPTGDFPVHGADGIIGYYNKKNVDESLCLITCRGNGSGNVRRTFGPMFVTNNCFVLRPQYKAEMIRFHFAIQAMESLNLRELRTGAAQPQLTLAGISHLEVLLPSSSLLGIYNSLTDSVFAQADNLRQQNEKLRSARDLLLPRLMSGEIAV
jgi:type I restriction enzyme S subunit